VVGCAPGAFHEIGSLILALFLRHDGYLFEFARVERPALICLSANSEATAREVRTMQAELAGMRPRRKFGFGGRLFNAEPKLRASMPRVFLGEKAASAREQVCLLLPI
jgi:methanogenic corrinoid protein MtbC1